MLTVVRIIFKPIEEEIIYVITVVLHAETTVNYQQVKPNSVIFTCVMPKSISIHEP